MNLVVFGLGYTARAVVAAGGPRFHSVAGTVRSPERMTDPVGRRMAVRLFDAPRSDPALAEDLRAADAVLVSIPPASEGDPVLRGFADELAAAPRLRWVGYLSTVGVYGDHAGAWVDEGTPVRPSSERARRRIAAEEAWLAWGRRRGKAVEVFRLAGIYGPGRNALVNLAAGSARRIVKPGQVFNRIHVDDIAQTLLAAMARPKPGAIYNVADDEPAPPQDVVAYAASLLGMDPPPETPFEAAALGPMAASFYGANRRVSNALVKRDLAIRWRYPTYREGLRALCAAGEGQLRDRE